MSKAQAPQAVACWVARANLYVKVTKMHSGPSPAKIGRTFPNASRRVRPGVMHVPCGDRVRTHEFTGCT
eukprot:353221-Chlamydomonas_euryale.AAC.3